VGQVAAAEARDGEARREGCGDLASTACCGDGRRGYDRRRVPGGARAMFDGVSARRPRRRVKRHAGRPAGLEGQSDKNVTEGGTSIVVVVVMAVAVGVLLLVVVVFVRVSARPEAPASGGALVSCDLTRRRSSV